MALELTGSIDITTGAAFTDQDGRYSGSFSGSFIGDGSGLTGVSVGGSSDFPYTGSAIISGSLEVEGPVTIISGSLRGQGSGLTEVNPFPYEGQADIIGALKVDGAGEFNYLSSSNDAWSVGDSMNVAIGANAGAGTQNAALSMAGTSPAPAISGYTCTEAYNGSAWSVKSPLNFGRSLLAGAGTQNAALAFGGFGPSPIFRYACTEKYNGDTWSEVTPMSTGRNQLGGVGTQNSAIAFGGITGSPGTDSNATEEYNGDTWSSGGNLNAAVEDQGGAGTQNASLSFGGGPAPTYTQTEEYNGTAWSIGGNLNNINRGGLRGSGTQNSALGFGGTNPACSPSYLANTEEYNGSTWSNRSSLNVARQQLGSAGGSTSALAFAGRLPANNCSTCTEEYNADACYRKHFYTQQNTVYADQLYVSGSSTVEAVFNLANRTDTPSPLTAGTVWQSGSAGAGCLYFTPDGSSICKISFA